MHLIKKSNKIYEVKTDRTSREIDKSTIIAKDFNTVLSITVIKIDWKSVRI